MGSLTLFLNMYIINPVQSLNHTTLLSKYRCERGRCERAERAGEAKGLTSLAHHEAVDRVEDLDHGHELHVGQDELVHVDALHGRSEGHDLLPLVLMKQPS